jgi:hypothetical protein
MNKSDIVERLRDAMVEVDYGDRLMAADEIERLRAALAEQQERFISLAVAAAAEREAIVASILELIERARADGHLTTAITHCALLQTRSERRRNRDDR